MRITGPNFGSGLSYNIPHSIISFSISLFPPGVVLALVELVDIKLATIQASDDVWHPLAQSVVCEASRNHLLPMQRRPNLPPPPTSDSFTKEIS